VELTPARRRRPTAGAVPDARPRLELRRFVSPAVDAGAANISGIRGHGGCLAPLVRRFHLGIRWFSICPLHLASCTRSRSGTGLPSAPVSGTGRDHPTAQNLKFTGLTHNLGQL
jgi:hypothetical protein